MTPPPRAGGREPTPRSSSVRRRRSVAAALLVLVAVAVALTVALAGGSAQRAIKHPRGATAAAPAPARHPPASFAVGLRTLRLVDPSRRITLPDGSSEPRILLTYVRYPALGASARVDAAAAPPDLADGPYPLIVFGHGFDVSPALYDKLLQSWARAGYVVAAPAFPLENPGAPGGADESDLVNQPADMRLVITRLLQASAASGPLAGIIDSSEIAVAGHSDGGDTALALAYDPRLQDRRVRAAAILSGAEIPALGAFTFAPGGPPLLATQGTADTVNLPSATQEFFAAAHRPKYLLSLLGAAHLPPYTVQGPQLGIVERVTIAFFDGYLKHRAGALQRLLSAGNVPNAAAEIAEP